MTESSFSCGLSSEMSECNVSVRYECTSRLTLGMPITTDTAGARRGDTGQGSGDSLSARLSPLPGHAHTSGATLAHPHCGLQTALLGQQVRQMVEDGGQMKHVPVRDVPRLQSRILWVGGKGAGQILLGLKTARLLQNPPPPSTRSRRSSPVRRPQVRLPSPSRSACLSDTALLISSSTRFSSLERFRLSCSAACKRSLSARNSRW